MDIITNIDNLSLKNKGSYKDVDEAIANLQDADLAPKKYVDDKSVYISVLDFGAVGDGVNDDTIAIQETIDFARDNNKIVFIPNGVYLISYQDDISTVDYEYATARDLEQHCFTIKSGDIILGQSMDGVKLVLSKDSTQDAIDRHSVVSSYIFASYKFISNSVEIKNLSVDASSIPSYGAKTEIDTFALNGSNIVLRNITIKNSQGSAIDFDLGSNVIMENILTYESLDASFKIAPDTGMWGENIIIKNCLAQNCNIGFYTRAQTTTYQNCKGVDNYTDFVVQNMARKGSNEVIPTMNAIVNILDCESLSDIPFAFYDGWGRGILINISGCYVNSNGNYILENIRPDSAADNSWSTVNISGCILEDNIGLCSEFRQDFKSPLKVNLIDNVYLNTELLVGRNIIVNEIKNNGDLNLVKNEDFVLGGLDTSASVGDDYTVIPTNNRLSSKILNFKGQLSIKVNYIGEPFSALQVDVFYFDDNNKFLRRSGWNTDGEYKLNGGNFAFQVRKPDNSSLEDWRSKVKIKVQRGSVSTDWTPNYEDLITDFRQENEDALDYLKGRELIALKADLSDYITETESDLKYAPAQGYPDWALQLTDLLNF